MSCTHWPPGEMLPPSNLPTDADAIDPWIAGFLGIDVETAKQLIAKRLQTGEPDLIPLVNRLAEYVPYQVMFSDGIGYVRCVRRSVIRTDEVFESIYIAQPLPPEKLNKRLGQFEDSVRPLIMEFLSRFAGCGEEMEGEMAGQFCLLNAPHASDFNARDDDSYGKWKDGLLLYAAMNGDSVFVDVHGATAWHVIETDEIVPIAEQFGSFLKDHADFRATSDAFDSWTWREFRAGKQEEPKLYREPD